MTLQQQDALVQEVLDHNHLYKENAALKNGLPTPPRRNVLSSPPLPKQEPAPAPPPQPANTLTERIVEKTTVTENPSSLVKNLLLGGALLSGGIGTGIGAAMLLSRDTQAPVVMESQPDATPVDPSPTVDPKYGDLLKYLRENGYNLPPQ